MLAPVLAEFAQAQPRVVVELLTDPRLYSLPRREADLVFRIKPFDEPEVIARRLLRSPYGVYIQAGRPHPQAGDGAGCPMVLMDTGFGGMPSEGSLNASIRDSNQRKIMKAP